MRQHHAIHGLFALATLAAFAPSACSSSSSSAPAAPGGPVARFKLSGETPPPFLDVPFPSDAYVAGGKVIDPVPGLDAVFTHNSSYITHGLGTMNGFSRVGMSMFYVDDPTAKAASDGSVGSAKIDPTTLPVAETECVTDTSAVYFLDLEATDPTKARIPCRAAFHDDSPHISQTRPMVAVGPARGIVLEEGHAYAAVMTSRVKDTQGRAIAMGDDFSAIASGNRNGAIATAYGVSYDKAMALLGPAFAADHAHIIAMAPYTTSKMASQLFGMREALETAPAATLSWDAAKMAPMGAVKFAKPVSSALPAGFAASLDDWLGVVDAAHKLTDGTDDPSADLPVRAHDKIAAFGTAVFDAINYLQVKPDGYADPQHATFAVDGSGLPIVSPDQPTSKIWISFAVPTAPMPATGYPIIIVQHGLNGSRAYILALANAFAAKGWMVAAIDSVTFGARASQARYQVDSHTDYEGSAPGAMYVGPDGLADAVDGARNGSGDLFGSLLSITAIRDQFRQSGLDTAQVVKLLRANPDLSPLATSNVAPKIDADKIAYMGDSLGAIEGTLAAAIEPNVKAWVMNVAGGGLFSELAARSATISFQLQAAGGINFGFGGDFFSESHPFVSLGQTVMDPGDSIAFARYMVTDPQPLAGKPTKARNVLQIQALYDEIVSNEANEAYARAAGFGLALPNVGSNAGNQDVAHPESNPFRIPFADVAPDAAGAIHDTPFAGVTAVLVQVSPGAHGADFVDHKATHQFSIPFGRFDSAEPFVRLDAKFQFEESNLELQAMATTFVDDAFKGNVPRVMGFKTPIRDFDGDGSPDATDSDPSDPKKP